MNFFEHECHLHVRVPRIKRDDGKVKRFFQILIFNHPFECVVECYFNGVTHSGFERTIKKHSHPAGRLCQGMKG
jgi:hypothetical protein